MTDLLNAIAECLSLHARSMDRLGTDLPELDARIDEAFRARVIRQRSNVSASLEGDPEQHRRHVESLNSALRIMLRRLAPEPASPPPPPLPTWDDKKKRWIVDPVTTGKARVEELARQFDERGPDAPNELFNEGASKCPVT
jgi:hypothetical protein